MFGDHMPLVECFSEIVTELSLLVSEVVMTPCRSPLRLDLS